MRHSLALLFALAGILISTSLALAAPPPIAVKWQATGATLALADLDGSPGLEVLVGGLASGRMEIIEPQAGTAAYQLPATYGDGLAATILVEDFDGAGGQEVMVWYRQGAIATHFGLFRWNGSAYVPRWEVTDGFATDAQLSSVDIVGNGIRHVVALTGQGLRIYDALNGVKLYDSSDLTPQFQPVSAVAIDIDGDGTEELVATGNDTSIPATVQVVIESIPNVGVESGAAIRGTLLGQNAPNPFRGPTRIAFTVPENGHVKLRVYDVTGRLVRALVDETRHAGLHAVAWDGLDARGRIAPSGSYFYELEVNGSRQSRRMVRVE